MDPNKCRDIHVTPSEEELLPNYIIKCSFKDCSAKFSNNGSYVMHKYKHHKITTNTTRMEVKLYHCPNAKCKYNIQKGEGFKDLRYLRQHYQKVHMQKHFACSICDKTFITLSKLNAHRCGEKFICQVCSWEYDSKEALLTHIKRKNHAYKVNTNHENSKFSIASLSYSDSTNDSDILKEYMDKETQTKAKNLSTVSVQTDQQETPSQNTFDFYATEPTNLADSLDMLLKDIETQTDYCFESTATMTCDPNMFDQELGNNASTNMYTQTCDNILRELGFSDIETQTYWPNNNEPIAKPTTKCSIDEFLVSTETQTSFSQYLLDPSQSTINGSANNVDANSLNTFYNTQHTQTCDMLYSDFFDDEDDVLMSTI